MEPVPQSITILHFEMEHGLRSSAATIRLLDHLASLGATPQMPCQSIERHLSAAVGAVASRLNLTAHRRALQRCMRRVDDIPFCRAAEADTDSWWPGCSCDLCCRPLQAPGVGAGPFNIDVDFLRLLAGSICFPSPGAATRRKPQRRFVSVQSARGVRRRRTGIPRRWRITRNGPGTNASVAGEQDQDRACEADRLDCLFRARRPLRPT